MVSLRILGGAALEGRSGSLSGRAAQRRQLALLAVLALSREKGVTRDKLIGLLWPETRAERARRSLSDSLYVLRRAVHDDLILTAGDALQLNPDVLRIDLWDFETALDTGDLETAVGLYGGPLLDGFHLAGSREFEGLLDGERQAVADAYARTLEALAERTEADGNHKDAAEWWKRFVAHDPYNSRAVGRLMQALAAVGDPANALEYARTHELRLREDLGVPLPEDLSGLIGRLREKPAPVSPLRPVPPATKQDAEPLATQAATPRATTATAISAERTTSESPQRAVLRALAFYVGTSFIVFAVVHIVVETLGLAAWLPRLAVFLLLVGLPLILVTAIVRANVAALRASTMHRPNLAATGAADSLTVNLLVLAMRRWFTWRNAVGGGMLAAAFWVLAAVWFLVGTPSQTTTLGSGEDLDPDVIAVMPFAVTGFNDLDYLREGLVDALAVALTGESGPRAADPRATLNSWRSRVDVPAETPAEQLARDIARTLGAGKALIGNVLGTTEAVVIKASLISVTTGEARALPSIEGTVDSLHVLVDQLAAELLAVEAGEPTHRLESLATASLPALRAYLSGQAAYRRGRYEEALSHYDRALALDSTFAQAALGYVTTSWWVPSFGNQRAFDLALANEDKLTHKDRALLKGWSVSAKPERDAAMPYTIDVWAWVTRQAPESPEAWYELGDLLFHWGRRIGYDSPWDRATQDFERAAQLDPGFAAPLDHLIELKLLSADTADVRSLSDAYLALDSTGDVADYIRWRVAHALEDSLTLLALRDRIPTMSSASLMRMIGYGLIGGFGLDDVDLAGHALHPRFGDNTTRWNALYILHALAMNRGYLDEAQAINTSLADLGSYASRGQHFRLQIKNALFWDGPDSLAARALGELEPFAAAALQPDRESVTTELQDLCVVTLWQLARGDTRRAEQAVTRLRSAVGEYSQDDLAVCARMLHAYAAVVENRPYAQTAVDQFEDFMLSGPAYSLDTGLLANLVLAGLLADLDQPARALAVVRRRPYVWIWGLPYLSSYLREEGRLAALTGDREGAIRAYRHFLALRSDPDPALAAEVARVHAELDVLLKK